MSDEDCSTSCAPAPLHEDPDVAIVMRGSLPDLQRAADRLSQHGVESTIVRADTEDAAGCCSTALYLVVAREEQSQALAVFDAEWKRGLTAEQVAALEAASGILVDPEAAEMTCPACLTTFATGPEECPDCGLALG